MTEIVCGCGAAYRIGRLPSSDLIRIPAIGYTIFCDITFLEIGCNLFPLCGSDPLQANTVELSPLSSPQGFTGPVRYGRKRVAQKRCKPPT
jgi:hypothetical protein